MSIRFRIMDLALYGREYVQPRDSRWAIYIYMYCAVKKRTMTFACSQKFLRSNRYITAPRRCALGWYGISRNKSEVCGTDISRATWRLIIYRLYLKEGRGGVIVPSRVTSHSPVCAAWYTHIVIYLCKYVRSMMPLECLAWNRRYAGSARVKKIWRAEGARCLIQVVKLSVRVVFGRRRIIARG